jgi:hypothetical protein
MEVLGVSPRPSPTCSTTRAPRGTHRSRSDIGRLTQPRGIFVQGRRNSINLLRAPFGKRADALLTFFLR